MYRIPVAITMVNASSSLAGLVGAIDAGESDVALDALAHSDSSAVAVLVAALRHAQSAGRTLRWSGIPASVASLAKLYGVDAFLGAAPATPASAFPAA